MNKSEHQVDEEEEQLLLLTLRPPRFPFLLHRPSFQIFTLKTACSPPPLSSSRLLCYFIAFVYTYLSIILRGVIILLSDSVTFCCIALCIGAILIEMNTVCLFKHRFVKKTLEILGDRDTIPCNLH